MLFKKMDSVDQGEMESKSGIIMEMLERKEKRGLLEALTHTSLVEPQMVIRYRLKTSDTLRAVRFSSILFATCRVGD